MGTAIYPAVGKAGAPAFPLFPQFTETDLPTTLTLLERNKLGISVPVAVNPIRAWQGIIRPFEGDEDAKLSLRLLAADRPIQVAGGRLIPGPEAAWLLPHAAELRMIDTSIAFDVLVLEFEPPAHPWVFSLSPEIAQQSKMHHPHLRTDRILTLPSRTLHGLCLYSAAEFAFEPTMPLMPQFLAQTSIFLGKHVIWMKTQRLFNSEGELINLGIDSSTVMSDLPAASIWQKIPRVWTQWVGLWPGTSAANGEAHLSNDPNRECWCGRGNAYKDCCFLWERNVYKVT